MWWLLVFICQPHPVRNISGAALPCETAVRGKTWGTRRAGDGRTELVLFEEKSQEQSALEGLPCNTLAE